MSQDQFDLFLNAAVAICAVMAIFNSLRYRSRGGAAFILAGAFVAFGITLELLAKAANEILIYVFAGISCLLLVADFVWRSGVRQEKERSKK